jgi:transposase
MLRALSNDLRKRVVTAVSKGESCRSVAARFGVAVSSVVKWSQRYRSTGSVAPSKMGGHRKPVLDSHRAFLVKRLSQTPNLTLHALKDELAARGVKVSHNTVWLFLRREGLRFKKTLLALEQGRSDVARRRRRWRSWQASLDPQRLVFIDETWIKTNMAPLRGWRPKGVRLRGFAPHGHWRTLTFLGALRCNQLTAPCVFDCPINGEYFRAYVEQQLVPVLKQGDIAIMDNHNLGSHKSTELRRTIRAAGARMRLAHKRTVDDVGDISEPSSPLSSQQNATTTSKRKLRFHQNIETL